MNFNIDRVAHVVLVIEDRSAAQVLALGQDLRVARLLCTGGYQS
jgi:hypothetical protein